MVTKSLCRVAIMKEGTTTLGYKNIKLTFLFLVRVITGVSM